MSMDETVRKVHDYIQENSLLKGGERVLLSLSAGKDSMAMLHVLDELKPLLGIETGIFHLNHQMRGDDSDEDERFLLAIAAKMNIPVFSRSFDFSSSDSEGRSFEEHARDIRYSMLEEVRSAEGFDIIATAHNLQDNTETLLMRMFQGTGLYGLQGIRCRRGNIIRPLRCCSVREILEYLRARGVSWREDGSNQDIRYRRNYIRNSLLPLVEDQYPRYASAMDELSGLACEYTELVDELSARLLGPLEMRDEKGRLMLAAFRMDFSRPLFNHIITGTLRKGFGFHVTTPVLDEIWRNYGTARSHGVLYRTDLLLIRKTLMEGSRFILVERPSGETEEPVSEWNYEIKMHGEESREINIKEAGITLTLSFCDYRFFRDNMGDNDSIFVTIDPEKDILFIRNRRGGDRIRLERGSKKIKDFFIEKKLDNETKNRIPLLIVNSDVAAVMTGFITDNASRVASPSKVTEKSEKILVITKNNDY